MAYKQTPPRDDVKALKEKIQLDYIGGYLFWGEEEYLKNYYRENLRSIVREHGMAEFNLVKVPFETGEGFPELENALDTPPVFSSCKMVEVTGLDLLGLKKEDEKRLLDAIDKRADDTILVFSFYFDELDLKPRKVQERKIVKELYEKLFVAEFPRQSQAKLLSWTDRIFTAESRRIKDVDIVKIIELCDYSMTRIKSESEKLLCMAGFEGVEEIPSSWITDYVLPSAENELYELCEAVASFNKKRASDILENIKLQNFEETEIFAAVTKTLAGLQILKAAVDKGENPRVIYATTGFFDWQAEKYARFLSKRSDAGLRKSLDLAFECDKALKGESTNKALALTAFITGLFREECL